eukprot:scaffold28518_cov131-Isochrysis_galbana.AAC.1
MKFQRTASKSPRGAAKTSCVAKGSMPVGTRVTEWRISAQRTGLEPQRTAGYSRSQYSAAVNGSRAAYVGATEFSDFGDDARTVAGIDGALPCL